MSKLLDILLQRNDPEVPWGFSVRGGADFGSHPVISSVTFGTLAAQYLNAGDKILEIDNQKANALLETEIEGIIQDGYPRLHLLVEKLPASGRTMQNKVKFEHTNGTILPKTNGYHEQEWVKEKETNGNKKSTKIWLRETKRDPTLGKYDLEVNFERTKYRDDMIIEKAMKNFGKNRNHKQMQTMSENFDKVFREKIGEWLENNMLNGSKGKQQSGTNPSGDGAPSFQPPPPPPPSFPGAIPGRRIKTEIPEKSLEPPSVIQNAMMTKDKKPFTYTPGGIDLSEIRSPKMQRRINRNACADEMPGIPAPTTNQPRPLSPTPNTHFSAMQSQLPAQVLPPGVVPPPPPPPPSSSNGSNGMPAPPPPPLAPSISSNPSPKPTAGRPPLGFDPNELLAKVNKAQPYEPQVRDEPPRNFKPQVEEKTFFEPKQQKPNENVFVPHSEPGHIYVPQVTPKKQNEPPSSYTPPFAAANHTPRAQLGSIYVPPVTTVSQEQNTPSPASPYGYKIQQTTSPIVTSPPEEKPQAPWVTVQRTPQGSVSWASREPEPAKQPGTRIIPIQIEGRDSPKPATPSPQPQATPPPFLQSPQMRQQQAMRQQQTAAQQQHSSNTRVIPIQIEGTSQAANNQPWSPGTNYNQNKFNPMTPQSPTPFSPSQERDQKPQWAPVQPRPFKKEPEVSTQRPQQEAVRPQQPQPEYGTYNTAGVPVSQLRKMQLSDDDRALMDKFKSQVEKEGNDSLSDKNSNLRYRGGCIPSKVFKMLDESVDDERYLHNESDPRYRGACIPSRAFRMLQSMTDTAGDVPQQVPRTQQQRVPGNRPLSGGQFQQEPPSGPYVPPSEQQAQEPRKYTGGSIPSRSFRMLQAMTGQEVSVPPGPPSGRETPVFGVNRWCPSPSPSPIDPYWGYYPPDPYYIYNYISDINAAYGFPPPPPPPPPFHPYYQMYQSYVSDNDEPGYSSTDELAQYNANFRRTFGYSPFQPNPERYSTPSFGARACATPIPGRNKIDQSQKLKVKTVEEKEVMVTETKLSKDTQTDDNKEVETVSESDKSDSDTEIEEEGDEASNQTNNLQTLKSVPNVNVYTSESSSTVVQEDQEEEESSEEEEEEDEEVSEEKEEPVPHQLSVIYEESEHSDVESIKRMERERANTISESESCSTLDNEDDDSDDEVIDPESSVTVRLPLKFQYKENDDVMTVTVGDSQLERDTLYDLKSKQEEEEEEEEEVEDEESSESDEGDISVTFTLPSRSNSVISVEHVEAPKEPEVQAEITVHVPLRTSIPKDDSALEKTESPLEDDSSSTSSGNTVLRQREDAGGEEEKLKMESFSSWMERENKDWLETERTETILEDSIKEGVGKLEEMISSLVETTKDVMSSSMELEKDLEPKKLGKKDSQEESEEDDSGVTSDMSIKQVNSETDADTESDYSELSKMTKFQRASTHSRLFKLLQEECERCGNEDDDDSISSAEKNTDLTLRKQNLTLPLNQTFPSEVESLSSSSGIASPSSPTISDRLVKELIHSLLNKKKGKKFRKLPMAKLHAAAFKILQEEMEYDTSPTSGDDGLFLSPMQKKRLHSKITAKFADSDETLEPVPESIYGENYYDYLDYYNTWGNPEMYNPEDYIVPSRAFRTLREQTSSPVPVAGYIGRCPRVASKKNIQEPSSGRQTPAIVTASKEPDNDIQYERISFAEKQEKVLKVLQKSGKS